MALLQEAGAVEGITPDWDVAANSSYAVLGLVGRLFPAKMEFVAALVEIGLRSGVRAAGFAPLPAGPPQAAYADC